MTTTSRTREVLDHERRFWDAMRDKDAMTAARMTADSCIVVGAQGVSAIDPDTMARLTREGEWELERYTFDEVNPIKGGTRDDLAMLTTTSGTPVTVNPNFGNPIAFQQPRQFRFGVRLTF